MTVSASFGEGLAPAEAPAGSEQPNSNSSQAAKLPTPMTPDVKPVEANAPTPSDPPAANVERPAWLPEGFDTPEAFVQAYQDLKANPVTKVPETPAKDPVEIITDATKAAGLDLDVMVGEFNKDGKLSDARYAELAKAGITRQFMDAAISGRMAAVAAEMADIYSVVGGEESFKTLQTWAGTNLSEAERNELNSVIDTASAGVVKLALQGLQARYTAKNGTEPSLLGGTSSGAPGSTAFESQAQITSAMSDPRYETDPAYRASIERRLAVTNF